MTARLLSCTSFHVLLCVNIHSESVKKDSTIPTYFTQELFFSFVTVCSSYLNIKCNLK